MYVADYVEHNVLRIDPRTRRDHRLRPRARDEPAERPGDRPGRHAVRQRPELEGGHGQLWRIDRDGSVTRWPAEMGTTNGIEVSPDGKTLYVNESVQRNVWAFTIRRTARSANKRLLNKFDDHGFDGMRCDVDGNLYITRYGKGTVGKCCPRGQGAARDRRAGRSPSNLCFGGPDGRTVYVTEVEHRRLVQFRVDRPGLAWQRWKE